MSNYFDRINGFPRRNRRNTRDINPRDINPRDINPRVLNYHQSVTLDLYVSMYNTTLRQINSLYENLNEIKHNIDYLVGLEDNFTREEPVPTEILIPSRMYKAVKMI